jgi:hypothetical protein
MALTMTMIITVMLGLACLELWALWSLGEHEDPGREAGPTKVRPAASACASPGRPSRRYEIPG